VGDLVKVTYDQTSFTTQDGAVIPAPDGSGISIDSVVNRACALIRPPMANLDLLLITVAAAEPAPALPTVDKLISIAEFNNITPVLIIGKCDLAPDVAAELQRVYELAGYPVFLLSATNGEGVDVLRDFLAREMVGKTAAFAGASGVGKSTLLGALFPTLHPETGEISHKIARGKHTTRRVQLYALDGYENAYLADTPGFSMLDFVRFDFFTRDDLLSTMREFLPFVGECRYTKCTHTKEQGCAILDAVRDGRIAESRHQSYLEMYEALKNKHEWSRK
jgi:ribosome biogenesis GTPase